jgi:hypothetical protein
MDRREIVLPAGHSGQICFFGSLFIIALLTFWTIESVEIINTLMAAPK